MIDLMNLSGGQETENVSSGLHNDWIDDGFGKVPELFNWKTVFMEMARV